MKRAVVGAVLVGLALTGCSGGGSTPAPSSSKSSVVKSTEMSTPVEETSTSVADAMYAWYQSITVDFTAVSDDLGTVSAAAGAYDISALTAGCTSLQTDVRALQSDEQAPDPETARLMRVALTWMFTASVQCLAADYDGQATSLNKGTEYLNQATQRIKKITAGN